MYRSAFVLLSLIAVLAAAGCAATTPKKTEIVCRKVIMTGSNIPKEICQPVDAAQLRETHDQEEMRKAQRSGSVSTPGK